MADRKPPRLAIVVGDPVARAKQLRALAAESRRQASLANTDAVRAAYMRLAAADDDHARRYRETASAS